MDDERSGDGFAIEHGHGEYSVAELLEQAQANAQALVIATAAFLDEGGQVAGWTAAIGERFERAWGEPRPWDAGEFLDAMLTNLRTLGAEVVAVEFGVDRAEATTVGFPDADLCALFGVDRALVARFNDGPTEIAGPRGLSWAWALVGDETRYTVDRTEPTAVNGPPIADSR